MAIRPFDFYVEMEKNDYTPIGEVKQLDTMELDIKVLENGVPKDLELSEIALYVRKKDGTILEQKDNINIVEASEGTIKIKVKNQATACVGMTLFELELKDNDGIATTGTFIFIVNERVVNGEVVESKDEIHALVEVEKYVKLAKEELQRFKELQTEMLRTNETINSNEEGRVSAEEKRVNAEKKRALAEEERETLFEQKEEERGTLFAQKELDRNNTFVQRERERNEKFEEAERNRAVAENERVIAEQARAEKFAEFESKISANTKELEGARTATTGENFDTLDERIDCEVDRLNKKIEVSFLQQEDKENYVIENTVDGMTTDMVVKGKTLQNLIKDGKGTFVVDKSKNQDMRIYTFKVNHNLVRGKKYAGYIEVDSMENTPSGLRIYGWSSKTGVSGGYFTCTNKVGVVKFKWNTSVFPENVGEIDTVYLYVEGNEFNNGAKTTFSDFMLFEEGTDLTNIDEYFEGIKSFGQQEDKISILSSGRNLIDDSIKSNTEIDYETGFEKPSHLIVTTGFTPFFVNTKRLYAQVTIDDVKSTPTFRWYDENKKYINGNTIDNIPTNARYVRMRVLSSIPINPNDCKFLLIDNSDKNLSYEPYKSNKKDILLSELGFDEGLRGLLSVEDELNSNKKKAIKRIDKYKFTGEEEIYTEETIAENNMKFVIVTNRTGVKPSGSVISDNFIKGNDTVSNSVRLATNNKVIINIDKAKLSEPSVEGFKTWLKANPTTIYYELAEPIETPLDESIALKVYNEKTYVNFENAISGTSSFKVPVDTVLALSNLTDGIRNKTDKKEVDEIDERASKSLMLSKRNFADTNDNIFPYIMDLELMILDMMALNGYTNKKYKIMERAGINMTSKQALERLIRQKKVTLEDALDRIVRYNDAGRITDAEALELTDLAHEIL